MVDRGHEFKKQMLTEALKVTGHPTRRKIIKELRKGESLSAVDLHKILNIDRYHLYHHVDFLCNKGLIYLDEEKSEGKLKFYKVPDLKGNPGMIGFSYDRKEIIKEKIHIKNILKELENIEDQKIPLKNKIKMVEIVLTYKER